MIEDHQKSSFELSLIVKPHIGMTPLPSKLDKCHQARIDKLKKLDGAEFTKITRSKSRRTSLRYRSSSASENPAAMLN
ncbi:hypothetical protein [Alsobacter metallidurans]|uniref:hypothetical protein n=1 Tax=Alsobacter metallidurans TaxID=340221 RepID=UPI00166673E8|nr:hypothetical protein [Alsobacter metallidurans]